MSPRPVVDRAMWGRVASWDPAGRPGLQVRRMGAAAVGRPEERPAEREPAERELAERELAERELAERELAEREVVEREPAERELAERELVEREPAEREPVERELVERELAGRGAGPGRLAAAGVSARVGKRERQVRPVVAGWAARIK